jgi:hypothetical protein
VALVSIKNNHKPPASFVKMGQTETQKNNLNPKWKKFFEIDWFFESKQELDIQIYDQDNDTTTLSDDDFLGSVQTTLGAVVGGMGGRITLPVQYKGKPHGTMTLTVEQLSGGKVSLVLFRNECQAASLRYAGFGHGD